MRAMHVQTELLFYYSRNRPGLHWVPLDINYISKDPKMTTTTNSVMNSVSADFRNQLDSLRSHEERLQASEATRIVAITLAGRCLANMRDELKEQGISDWEKRLAQEARLPISEVQRRILIGTHWADSIETAYVQALLSQLPADTLKLEWICRIPIAELPSFLSEVDCRRLDREAVKRAVPRL